MSESERRSGAKLHKQPEVEDDDGDEAHQHAQGSPVPLPQQPNRTVSDTAQPILPQSSASATEEGKKLDDTSGAKSTVNVSGVRTPTIQSASSSSETSPDEGQIQPPVTPSITRKQTLTRTQALEGTSPPPESFFSGGSQATLVSQSVEGQGSSLDVPNGHSGLTNGGGGAGEAVPGQVPGSSMPQLQKKTGHSTSQEAKEFLLASHKISSDSGHGTLDTTDAGSDTSVLSRDSSLENSAANLYKDSSGVNIPRFIRETMLKSAKDKRTVLAYEKQLIDFCRNESSQVLKMAEASSYDRMIAHRLSAFMGLEHNVDSTGKSVIINKTENMRIVKITDFIKLDDGEQDTKKKILLKKPASLDEKHSRGASKGQFGSHRAKSLEERQQIYSEVRERIFKDGENQGESSVAPSLLTAHFTPSLHHQRSLDSATRHGTTFNTPLLTPPPPPPSSSSHHYHQEQHQPQHHLLHPAARWSSTDSATKRSNQGASDLRAATMIKSNSYGGVGSDPMSGVPGFVGSGEPNCGATLSFVDSGKDSYSTPPSSMVGPPPSMCQPVTAGVAPDLSGSEAQQSTAMTEESQSLVQPHVNADGSLYRFDPSCPPPFMAQPLVHASPPAVSGLQYQMENLSVSELSGKFANSAPLDPMTSGIAGQLVMSHPQTALTYPSSHPIQLNQGQYYPSLSPGPAAAPGNPPFHVLTYAAAPAAAMTPTGQGHHARILQPAAAPLEAPQGQTTVPMPAVGLPPPNLGSGGAGATTYVLGPANPYDIGGAGNMGSGVMMYATSPYPQTVSETLGGVGDIGLPLSQPNHHQQLVQYNIAAAATYGHQPQPHLHHLQQQQQQQVMVSHSGATYFTAVQQSTGSTPTPTPPPPPLSSHQMALPQLPPPPPNSQQPQIPPPSSSKVLPSSSSSQLQHHHLHHPHQQHQQQQHQQQHHHHHHHQQPPTVFYTPGLGGSMTVSPLAQGLPNSGSPALASNPQPSASIVMAQQVSSTNTTTHVPKPSGPSPFHIQYHSSPPPQLQQPLPQHLHQHHQQHQQIPASPSNGQHPQQLTLGQPLSLVPASSSSGPTGGPRSGPVAQPLVAYQPVRPVGTIIQLGSGPAPVQQGIQPLVQPSPVGPAAQMQAYQILRPAGPELRMMNAGSIRPRLAALQFSSPHHGQQTNSKSSNRQQRKGGPKRASSETKDNQEEGRTPQQTTLGGSASLTQHGGLHLQQHPQQHQQPPQQPLIVAPLIPGMMGHHPHIPPASAHRPEPPARL